MPDLTANQLDAEIAKAMDDLLAVRRRVEEMQPPPGSRDLRRERPDLTPERIARLRRLAALARDRDVDSDAVALFSAAVSPDVVTALLDEIELMSDIVTVIGVPPGQGGHR